MKVMEVMEVMEVIEVMEVMEVMEAMEVPTTHLAMMKARLVGMQIQVNIHVLPLKIS